MQALLAEEDANAEIARKIYGLRTQTGLSQRALAKLIGTTASVLCRVQDSVYEGHSLASPRSPLVPGHDCGFVQLTADSR